MISRSQEKLHQAKRRLAAVAFLTNISLDGSYKDSGWPLEYAKQQEQAANSAVPSDQGITFQAMTVGDFLDLNPGSESGYPASNSSRHSRRTSDGNEYEYRQEEEEDNPHSEYLTNLIRSRANTVHIEPKYAHHGVSRQDSSGQGRRAHFSSSESMDHPVSKGQYFSNTNVSDSSSAEYNRGELRIVPMREVANIQIRSERLVVLVAKRSLVYIYSVIPYGRSVMNPLRTMSGEKQIEGGGLRRRNTSGGRPIPQMVLETPIDPLEQLIHRTKEEVSYGYLLRSYIGKSRQQSLESNSVLDENDLIKRFQISRAAETGGNEGSYAGTGNSSPSEYDSQDLKRFLNQYPTSSGNRTVPCNSTSTYSPHLLDDPEFRAGKHRTLLTFPSYITSVIDYCKPSDMKKELNDKFRDRFPQVQLTLSKLKSLKREMTKVVRTECNIDYLTVAQAFVYFEKLILGSFVTKYNRKFCAGACILLSAKLNDVKGSNLHNLLEIIERTFRVSRKELITFEFAVLIALEFTLHLPTWEVFPHYQRLLYES